MCGGFTEMLLSWDTTHSLPGFVWAVLPRSGPKTNCSKKWCLLQGSTAQQRGRCCAGRSTRGACGIFMSAISPHRLVRETPGPIPGTSSKKGLVVSKNTTQWGKCFQAWLERVSMKLVPGHQVGEVTALYQQGSTCWGPGEVLPRES